MSKGNGHTPIQTAMLKVLSDGRPHTRAELHACCGPSSLGTIRVHLCYLRKKLSQRGEDIICVSKGTSLHYQHVRLLVSPYIADS
jgi:hypothetical protein